MAQTRQRAMKAPPTIAAIRAAGGQPDVRAVTVCTLPVRGLALTAEAMVGEVIEGLTAAGETMAAVVEWVGSGDRSVPAAPTSSSFLAVPDIPCGWAVTQYLEYSLAYRPRGGNHTVT